MTLYARRMDLRKKLREYINFKKVITLFLIKPSPRGEGGCEAAGILPGGKLPGFFIFVSDFTKMSQTC